MNIPGETTASVTLKSDILGMINMIEQAQAPGCKHKIVDTKIIGVEGRTVRETWVVQSCGKEISCPVDLTPDPNGGTYFGVKTPDVGVR